MKDRHLQGLKGGQPWRRQKHRRDRIEQPKEVKKDTRFLVQFNLTSLNRLNLNAKVATTINPRVHR